MLEKVDARIKEWASEAAAGVRVSFEPPRDQRSDEPLASIYLFELSPLASERGIGRKSLDLELHYLVTTSAADPESAHALLGSLLRSAATTPGFQVEVAVPPALWSSLAAPIRPGFVIRTPCRELAAAPAPRVLRAPTLRHRTRLRIDGIVLGPEDMPLAGASIRAKGMLQPAHSDARGRFQVDVPEPEGRTLQIEAHYKGLAGRVSPTLARLRSAELIVVHIDVGGD